MTTPDTLDTLLNALVTATADYYAGRVGNREGVDAALLAIHAEFERVRGMEGE